ncbi:hypothetical protein QBC46DRAFT_351343 [Diplogelasinospora grovesii]|uniref:UBC core domain-containing protein n=1 Tax=Diplogelasinospora grovesii TaxID=303347 RepID=A0AAN6NCV9_9PEZI|nr:hypothetical protein QBC46DRAFT_351343 [Diplogelasinospora grovesii]
MSVRRFRSDVSAAAEKAASGGIPGVTSISRGDSDGEVVVTYRHANLPRDIRIQALAQDASEYPDGNMFMLFTEGDDTPAAVTDAMAKAQDYLIGTRVCQMATELARRIEDALTRFQEDGDDVEMTDMEDGDDAAQYDAEEHESGDDEDYDLDSEIFGLAPSQARSPTSTGPVSSPSASAQAMRRRLKRDLRQVKEAGYKVSAISGLSQYSSRGILSMSIRVDRLGLSDEALEAWDVDETDYIVLLVRFEDPYTPLEQIAGLPASQYRVGFRIGKCDRYKPGALHASLAFQSGRAGVREATETSDEDPTPADAPFRKLLISNSLDQFMNESFLSLLKLRAAHGCSWDQANDMLVSNASWTAEERELNLKTGSASGALHVDPASEDHEILTHDHLQDTEPAAGRSFPLIAMQFAMRRFVKCTEFCLRCHRRLEKGFEALRPYVCSDPLCLFQYMTMGLGPNIEHEIRTEPYAVDLLVGLCYSAIQPRSSQGRSQPIVASQYPIRDFPVGLRIQVPNISREAIAANGLKARVRADGQRFCLYFEGEQWTHKHFLQPNQWLALPIPGQDSFQHGVVVYASPNFTYVEVQIMARSGVPAPAAATPDPTLDEYIAAVVLYNTDLDTLETAVKASVMSHVLDTLPPIPDIEAWLERCPQSSWRSMEGLSPAAAGLLQWIVSSNRSCIRQVDCPPREHEATSGEAKRNRQHERIPGMDGWMQFRFAQGSPDKELRFNRALQEVVARKPSAAQNPTIFAWHGSHLSNWHSIVRSGLDFQDVRNGRVCGNGVYFSRDFYTSLGYLDVCARRQWWPNSVLKVDNCMSLNEIINAPDEFVSSSPHYVVSQLDWHQCRYLFVQTQTKGKGRRHEPAPASKLSTKPADTNPTADSFHPQAKGLEIHGPEGNPLNIPLAAIPSRILPASGAGSSGGGQLTLHSLMKPSFFQALNNDNDEEDVEDIELLSSDDEVDQDSPDVPITPGIFGGPHGARPLTPASQASGEGVMTDFVPGSLDLLTIARMPPPSFANEMATRTLGRELKKLQTLQAKTPVHELGWYIDFDSTDNLFQWIVELHSFDPSLPLAQDMKCAGITSVVLEVRFGKDFPMSPPFVRVIRPRFLPLMNGGGGHVTAGGAMCMELLTNSGWSPANSMESVLLQVRMALCSLDPKPARLQNTNIITGDNNRKANWNDYQIGEAIDAYIRATNAHGWKVPEDLRRTATGV